MNSKAEEKEQLEKLKALRRELEEKIEEQLPAEMLEGMPKIEVQVVSGTEELDPDKAKQVIESLLFAATKPLTVQEIRKVVKTLTPTQITGFIHQLRDEYVQTGRSFEIIEIANGFEVAAKKDFAPWIMKIELQKRARQASMSALETLAILAYKQPITRAEIEELRGVDVSAVLTTLVERNFIKIVGRKEVPGRPFMYGTTEKFLEHFGLKGIAELPPIEEIKKLVENSIRKEDLLNRPPQIVDVPRPEGETAAAQASDTGIAEPPAPETETETEISTEQENTHESEPNS